MESTTRRLPKSLDRLIQMIEKAKTTQTLNPQNARELVLQANIQIEDLVPYADFNHPTADCYGRKLAYDGGWFEVMVMSWNPGDYSSIHNHGHTQWGVVQVFGHTHHMIYHTKDNELRFSKKEILSPGSAIKVNHELIHQMGNATTTPYMTLHVYGCNHCTADVTADAKNFDLEYNRIAHTCGGAFFNLPAENIYDFEPGPKPTEEVFMHYAHLLLDYYNRQEMTEDIREKKQHLFRLLQKHSQLV